MAHINESHGMVRILSSHLLRQLGGVVRVPY